MRHDCPEWRQLGKVAPFRNRTLSCEPAILLAGPEHKHFFTQMVSNGLERAR
jgi:hypothetical protein